MTIQCRAKTDYVKKEQCSRQAKVIMTFMEWLRKNDVDRDEYYSIAAVLEMVHQEQKTQDNKPLKSDGRGCVVFDDCNLKEKVGCNDCSWHKPPAFELNR